MSPDVSIVIPTHNRLSFLRKAVASCYEGNESLDIEVIVVDDGSTDNTREWGKSLDDDRVRYVRQESQGAQIARNRGMREARGEFIKFLDDDDRLIPSALEKEVSELRGKNADICCGFLRVKNADGSERVIEQTPAPDLISGIFKGSVWTHPHVFLYRAKAIENCYWDPSIPYHQDTQFAIETASRGLQETAINDVVAWYRDHEGESISNDVKSAESTPTRLMLRVELIEDGVEGLKERGILEDYHVKAAVEGMWQWTHMIAGFNIYSFLKSYQKIESIQPRFRPDRQNNILKISDALFGAKTTELIMYPARKAKKYVSKKQKSIWAMKVGK